MNDYYEVRLNIHPCSEDITDLLAAFLGEIGYDSFVADEDGLNAYIPYQEYNEEALHEAIADFPIKCEITTSVNFIAGQDWNAEWEKNYFHPIIVGNECVIHSSFHTDIPKAEYDIVIDPKMAFGTGHHATTSQIIQSLLKLDLKGKSVIDMGTGTGILAILAAMRGANHVTGIEIDPCAYENALENIRLNSQQEINLILGDATALETLAPVDIFIANINRNIITNDLPKYTRALKSGGTMILSGFYEHDIPTVMAVASKLGLKKLSYTTEGDNWAALMLCKD